MVNNIHTYSYNTIKNQVFAKKKKQNQHLVKIIWPINSVHSQDNSKISIKNVYRVGHCIFYYLILTILNPLNSNRSLTQGRYLIFVTPDTFPRENCPTQ